MVIGQIVFNYLKARNDNGNGYATKYEVKQIAKNQDHCMGSLAIIEKGTARQVDLLEDIKKLLSERNIRSNL